MTLRKDVNVSISLLPAIFAAVLFGPLAAMAGLRGIGPVHLVPACRAGLALATRALTGALAAGAVGLVVGHVARGNGSDGRGGDGRRAGR